MRYTCNKNHMITPLFFLSLFISTTCLAVNTKITRHSSSSDMLEGETDKIVISSRGTIRLGRAAETIIRDFNYYKDVWSINSIVVSGSDIYFGTSPNGGIYKYSLDEITQIYPLLNEQEESDIEDSISSEDNSVVEADQRLSNEHIFAMAADSANRLLFGISGEESKLCRYEDGQIEIVYKPDEAKYIFAIVLDAHGNIYLGTGPEGKIYRLDESAENPEVLYDSRDNNILSLAVGQDNCIYAGSDSRGLIYKIDTLSNQTTVIYDSEQPEIAALLFAPRLNEVEMQSTNQANSIGSLYAAATSAQIVQTQTQFATSVSETTQDGRPEDEQEEENESSFSVSEGGRRLEIANTQEPREERPTPSPSPITRSTRRASTSNVLKINQEGFVTNIFREGAVFLCMAVQDKKLLIGTGNNAQLYSIEPDSEQQSVIFEDEQAVQITAIGTRDDDVFIGTANPAKLIKINPGYANEGTYISELIDAEQPAKWGKLQLDADIPAGCKILMASRSGNVEDVNDPTYSPWSELVEITEPTQLQCPLGRFCQYKLVLRSEDGNESPLIREIAVASTIPNLAPKVESLTISRNQGANKEGTFRISYRTTDDNEDELIYNIDFRRIDRLNWIRLKDNLDVTNYEWDGKTVEDGRYEIRVTASDEKSNSVSTKLTGSRISEPIIVDNTGPVIDVVDVTSARINNRLYRVFEVEVNDELSAIGRLEYTIDSNADWTSTIPDDLVFDTKNEYFTVTIDEENELPEGDHVLSIKVDDAVGNTTYKTFEINL